MLAGLAGRAPVRFLCGDGTWINNIDVTHALKPFALPQYALLQRADGRFEFTTWRAGAVDGVALRAALQGLLGDTAPLSIEFSDAAVDKVVQYRSELPGGAVGEPA